MRLLLLVLALLCLSGSAVAHDENHAQYDPETLRWFQGLTNQLGHRCCNGLDSVKPEGWRIGAEGYEVQLTPNGPWFKVPYEAIVREPNLLNESHVWPSYNESTGEVRFRCFMPGGMG